MRIQSQDLDAGVAQAEALLQVVMQDFQDSLQPLPGQGSRYCMQRNVRSRQGDSQFTVGEQHHGLRHLTLFREILGVTAEWKSGFIDDAFLDRAGDHGGEFIIQAAFTGALQRRQNIFGVGRIWRTGMDGFGGSEWQDTQTPSLRRLPCIIVMQYEGSAESKSTTM